MRDPSEGVAADGTIVTGARMAAVPAAYRPLLDQAVAACPRGASLYLFGSVATGQARPPSSDVDLIALDWPPEQAGSLAEALSEQWQQLCREVQVGAGRSADHLAEGDEAYGNRVFLHHYAVHLTGPVAGVGGPFPADARAARGFNGDVARHAASWRTWVQDDTERPGALGRTIGRKSLLAVAGLVSVHEGTWTTDRAGAAARWAAIRTDLEAGLAQLAAWAEDAGPEATRAEIRRALDGVVAAVVEEFRDTIGLW